MRDGGPGQRDQADQRGGMHHAVERAGAQQLGGPCGAAGEMRGERAGHHRGKPAQPGDRQPQPDHRRASRSSIAAR